MKNSLILILFLFTVSCDVDHLNSKIKKSQIQFYKKNKVYSKRTVAELTVFEKTRREAFKFVDSLNFDNNKFYFIECFDVTTGNFDEILIYGNKEFYFSNNVFDEKIKLLDECPIDHKLIEAYINNRFLELTQREMLSGYTYLGTTIIVKNSKLKINHLEWL